MQKRVTQSKTVWTAIIISALALLWPGLDESLGTSIALVIEAAIFLILRLVTNSGVKL